MNILVLEPYYGGSHKAFLDQLISRLPFSFELVTLPARKWKWRMRLSAPYFAGKLSESHKFDRVLCSTFVDVATLRALGPEWLRHVPLLTYFHENQFAYPVQVKDERDFHFALTNLTTALASDRLAFNSRYNLESFLAGCRKIVKVADDMQLDTPDLLREKISVLYPGLDFEAIDLAPERQKNGSPVIIWNHRWEHDKNPDEFFQTLFELDRRKIDFQLVVLGQSFQRRPEIFQEARERLAHRILHFGYVKSRREYIDWLKQGDLVISTASHEFYGMAVIEAVRAGCTPFLPDRLSYPELFPPEFLYPQDGLTRQLEMKLKKRIFQDQKSCCKLTEKFSWQRLTQKYVDWFV